MVSSTYGFDDSPAHKNIHNNREYHNNNELQCIIKSVATGRTFIEVLSECFSNKTKERKLNVDDDDDYYFFFFLSVSLFLLLAHTHVLPSRPEADDGKIYEESERMKRIYFVVSFTSCHNCALRHFNLARQLLVQEFIHFLLMGAHSGRVIPLCIIYIYIYV